MAEEALRYNSNKLKMSLVPASLNRYCAAGLTYGALKYTTYDETGVMISSGVDNWRKGFQWRDLLDSLERHLNDFKEGRDIDDNPTDGSMLPHLCGMACNLAFLIEHFDKGLGNDDRTKTAPGRVLQFRLPPVSAGAALPPGNGKRKSTGGNGAGAGGRSRPVRRRG